MIYKILDTNILLLDHTNLLTLGKSSDTTIVLPETVLDELDGKKSESGSLGYQARAFGRLLTRATHLGSSTTGDYTVTRRVVDNITIHIVACSEYPDYSSAHHSIINDRKIIHIAKIYAKLHDTVFYTNDVMCGIRAQSLGLQVSDIKLVDDTDPDFIRSIEVTPEQFGLLSNSNIYSVNPDHKPENFNYRFTCESLGYEKLATIKPNFLIDVIGKKQESDLRAQDLNPINSGQMFLSAAIQDLTTTLVLAEAPAGTGKTATAISNAMKLVRQNNSYESITYIRASIDDVEDIEQIGFLPGSADDKNLVYLHPLYDTLDFIIRERHKKSKLKGQEFEQFVSAKVEELQEYYNIQAMTGLGMRGRTFNNTIAIIDEVQNQSQASLQKMLTRFGKNCKIIIIGSNRQIDNAYITKYNNGLSVLLNQATKPQDIIRLHVVPLTKIVRSPIAEWAEKIYSKEPL